MENHEIFMRRCFDLARLGSGKVSPNPMVGACIVSEGQVIGEGYHQKYATAHAEVNAFNNVSTSRQPLLRSSTLYVSLEPCCIYGKTPPCTELIIREKVPRVVISCLDLSPEVAGKGVQRLREAGCEVVVGVLEEEGKRLSAFRNTYVTRQRPYIILKYAQSQDGGLGYADRPVWLSNPFSRRLVHKWRSETDAILVGSQTALIDNPRLTNRLYTGPSPLRVVLDGRGRIPPNHHVLDDQQPTLIVGRASGEARELKQTRFFLPQSEHRVIEELLDELYRHRVTSLLVEGGAKTLQSFLDRGLWDEARVFSTAPHLGARGIAAPRIPVSPARSLSLGNDRLSIFFASDTLA